MRSDETAGARRLPWLPCGAAGDCDAAKDAEAGAVRDHRANPRKRGSLDQGSGALAFRLPVSGPDSRVAPSIDASVCAARVSLDTVNWTRRHRVRHAHDASDQSIPDLSPDKKPQGRTAAPWS